MKDYSTSFITLVIFVGFMTILILIRIGGAEDKILAAIQAPRPVHATATAPMPHKRPLLSAAGGIGEVGVSEISEREIRSLVGRK